MARQHPTRPAVAVVAAVLTSSLALPAVAKAPAAKTAPNIGCRDKVDAARELTIQVEGQAATGHYALPRRPPAGLAVFAHGYQHTSASWVEHMKNAARRGLAAVTMDNRGIEILSEQEEHGYPRSRGWNVWTGAEDSIAAAKLFQAACPSIEKTVIMGVSMGGNTSGLAVAMAAGETNPDGGPLFDYWIDVEGAVNVVETYLGARALEGTGNETAQNGKEDIEAAMGGPIEEVPEAYVEHAVVSHIDDIQASGVKGVVVIHGIDDGLVPYNQGREMSSLLLAAGVPTDMFSVGRKSPESERETTMTGYVAGQADENYRSPFAGHASEVSETHIVMVTAFDRLWALFDGEEPGPYREFMVDGEMGIYPEP